MKSINFGHSFTIPFESDIAIFARILQCNPASSLYRINIMLRNAVTPEPTIGFPTFNRAAESRLMAHYLQSIKDNNLAPPDSPTYSYTTGVHYNCPDCAYALYHTRIYDTPWFNFCEIHRKKIVMRCPECSQPWPVLLVDLNRKCSFCGVKKDLNEFIKARKRITPQSLKYLKKISLQLHWLQTHGAYWSSEEFNLNNLRSDTGIGTNDNLLLVLNSLNRHSFGAKQFKSSLKDSFNYYSFSLLPSSNAQENKKQTDKSKEQLSFLNHPDYEPEVNALVTEEPSHIHNARIEALSDIFLKYAASIENFDWEELYISDGVCEERSIFIETLSLWLYFILVPYAKYSIDHKEAYCPGYFCFQNDWLPHVPQPYYQLQNTEQTHELRQKDTAHLYRLELMIFFDELYWHINKLTELFKERRNVYTTILQMRLTSKSVAKANRPILILNQDRGIIVTSKETVCKDTVIKKFKDDLKKTPLFLLLKYTYDVIFMEQTIYSIFRNVKNLKYEQLKLLNNKNNHTSGHCQKKVQRILQSHIVRVMLCFHHSYNSWCWLHVDDSKHDQTFELIRSKDIIMAIKQLIESDKVFHYDNLEFYQPLSGNTHECHLVELYKLNR